MNIHSGSTTKTAALYRMVMEDHLCPYGLKAKDLLERKGFAIDDHHLETRAETDAFLREHNVKTSPQVWIGGERIGGYDALREYFGEDVKKDGETSYQPVLVVFAVAALITLAASWNAFGEFRLIQCAEWFIAISMCLLAMLKLQNVEQFSTMFLNYDLLARRWVRYGYIYPFAELLAGVLMVAGALHWISIPVALFIGIIGGVSVAKAVWIDKRELKCACVGGDSSVPLGFLSFTENAMMVAMALWMLVKPALGV